jgi:hypothetical protein
MSTDLDEATLTRLLAPFVAEAAALKKLADRHKCYTQCAVGGSILLTASSAIAAIFGAPVAWVASIGVVSGALGSLAQAFANRDEWVRARMAQERLELAMHGLRTARRVTAEQFDAFHEKAMEILVNERNEWSKLTLGTRPDLPTLNGNKRLTAAEQQEIDEASEEEARGDAGTERRGPG